MEKNQQNFQAKRNVSNSSYGPIFCGGHDLGINLDFIKYGGWLSFPYTYQDIKIL